MPRHLAAVEIPLTPHDVIEQRQLAFIRKELKLSRFREIGLRGKHRHRGETIIAVARHRSRGDRRAMCRLGNNHKHGFWPRRKCR